MQTLFRRGLLLACLLAPAAPTMAAPSEEGANIKIDNFTFSPAKLTISKGTEVTWTNQDDIPHTIVLTAIGVRSKTLDTDKTYTYRSEKAGTFAYICGLHPHMHGQVVVK